MTMKTLTVAIAAIAGLGLTATAQIVTPAAQPISAAAEGVSDPLSQAAALYATYNGDVTDVKTSGFKSTHDIDRSLNNLGGHNPDQLSQGWMAYSALIAAQNSEFRAAVFDIEGYYGREVFVTGLRNDPRYARTLNGGNSAVSASLSAVNADSKRLIGAAAYVKEQAYSLQGTSWAKGRVRNTGAKADGLLASTRTGIPARSAMLRAMSSPEINGVLTTAGQSGSPSVWDSVSSAASSIRVPAFTGSLAGTNRIARGKEPIADRITTLAAFRIIGSDPSSAQSMRVAMQDRESSACLNMANLNLQQCVAAAHNYYEVPFCIGEHALADVGQCIGQVTQ